MRKSSLERNLLNLKSHSFSSNHYNTVKKPREIHHFLYLADRKDDQNMSTILHPTDSRRILIFLNVLNSVECCSDFMCVRGPFAV